MNTGESKLRDDVLKAGERFHLFTEIQKRDYCLSLTEDTFLVLCDIRDLLGQLDKNR